MSQIVYVFVNEAMPGYIKIGMTTRESLKGRLDTLSSHTGVANFATKLFIETVMIGNCYVFGWCFGVLSRFATSGNDVGR